MKLENEFQVIIKLLSWIFPENGHQLILQGETKIFYFLKK